MIHRQLVTRSHTYYYDSRGNLLPNSPFYSPDRQALSFPFPNSWSRLNPNSHTHAAQIGTEPRPFSSLEVERNNLQRVLNGIDERCRYLVRGLAAADEAARNASGRERNEAKGRCWRLRKQIVESIKEEKILWAHLADLHIEIQSRERWFAIWVEERHKDAMERWECLGGNMPPTAGDWLLSPPFEAGAPAAHVSAYTNNATTVHHTPYQQLMAAPAVPWEHPPGAPDSTVMVSMGSSNADSYQVLPQPGLEGPQGTSSTSTRVRKRRSLPSLGYAWGGTSGEEAGHACTGYVMEGKEGGGC